MFSIVIQLSIVEMLYVVLKVTIMSLKTLFMMKTTNNVVIDLL